MTCNRDPRVTPGFTFLEVLITLSVAAIALTALIRLQAVLQRDGALARERAVATSIATARLERLRTASRATGTAGLAAPPPESVQRHGTRYRSTVTLDAGSTVSADVTVTWSDSGGRRRSVRLVSLLGPGTAADSGAAVAAARRVHAQ